MAGKKAVSTDRLSTGISGLDELLNGGLLAGRAYLVRGGPGTGKTTLGLHFLSAGAVQGQKVLFITLAEPESQIRRNGRSIGLDLEAVTFLDLSPNPEFFAQAQTYDIFSPAEVERNPITSRIVHAIEKDRPTRVFVDPMTQLRYLASDPFQYRRQALSFLRFLSQHGTTVLFTSEGSAEAPDADLQFLSDGVIELHCDTSGRTAGITKLRGSGFKAGRHAMELTDRGMEVFPRLVPSVHRRRFVPQVISSGLPQLDQLLHGGLEKGTITIISGPSGVGKTSLGLLFMEQAASEGHRSVVYAFEEDLDVVLVRCRAIRIPIDKMIRQGNLSFVQVEPLRYSADEFAHMVRHEVERLGSRIVMIDSISGYRLSLGGEDLERQLHALSKYLTNMGVTTLLINEIERITGEFCATERGISYIADNILFIRYLETRGQLCRAIGVLKKRVGDFERTLREFDITTKGIRVGQPLSGLRGVLTGNPQWPEDPSQT